MIEQCRNILEIYELFASQIIVYYLGTQKLRFNAPMSEQMATTTMYFSKDPIKKGWKPPVVDLFFCLLGEYLREWRGFTKKFMIVPHQPDYYMKWHEV